MFIVREWEGWYREIGLKLSDCFSSNQGVNRNGRVDASKFLKKIRLLKGVYIEQITNFLGYLSELKQCILEVQLEIWKRKTDWVSCTCCTVCINNKSFDLRNRTFLKKLKIFSIFYFCLYQVFNKSMPIQGLNFLNKLIENKIHF